MSALDSTARRAPGLRIAAMRGFDRYVSHADRHLSRLVFELV